MKYSNFQNYSNSKLTTDQIIAHAGGAVDSLTYTNSLESLDQNYKNGFRLFELDILETSDGKFVAAHDWESWRKFTKTKDSLITEEVFLKNKLFDRYTPLNIERINQWFKDHQDAFLITDKTNKPKKFANKFIDKSRLGMELFSLAAIFEAKKIGIQKIIASDKLFLNSPQFYLKIISDLDIAYLALSRKRLQEEYLLKELKKYSFKIYLYHIDRTSGFGEHYVYTNELDIAYGMYADYWDFDK